MSFFDNKKPTIGLYILVWILAIIPVNIALNLINNFIINSVINNLGTVTNSNIQKGVNIYSVVSTPIQIIFGVAIIVFVYKKFPNLKLSKVMPWIYFAIIIGIVRDWIENTKAFELLDVNLNLYNLTLIFWGLATAFGVRYFFIKSKNW